MVAIFECRLEAVKAEEEEGEEEERRRKSKRKRRRRRRRKGKTRRIRSVAEVVNGTSRADL